MVGPLPVPRRLHRVITKLVDIDSEPKRARQFSSLYCIEFAHRQLLFEDFLFPASTAKLVMNLPSSFASRLAGRITVASAQGSAARRYAAAAASMSVLRLFRAPFSSSRPAAGVAWQESEAQHGAGATGAQGQGSGASDAAKRTLPDVPLGNDHPWTVSPRDLDLPALRELAAEYPSYVHLPLQWGDMDAFGHLNNVLFMRYFETARMQYMLDLSQHLPAELRTTLARPTGAHAGPIVGRVTTRFRSQVHYPDTLTYLIRTRPADVAACAALLQKDKAAGVDGSAAHAAATNQGRQFDRVQLEYVAVSHRLDTIVADGDAGLVTFDYAKNQKCAIPEYLARAICEWEARGRKAIAEKFLQRSS